MKLDVKSLDIGREIVESRDVILVTDSRNLPRGGARALSNFWRLNDLSRHADSSCKLAESGMLCNCSGDLFQAQTFSISGGVGDLTTE